MSRFPSVEVRRAFVEYFHARQHEVVPSSPLVPPNDPTLMFTNAGMVQFKDVFVGKDTRPYRRATSCQKVIRISGKHNDLENVGVTARHHTFFEMLGNFSFGDYFKEEAIAYAWELLTSVYALDPRRLVITVFGGEQGVPADDEARALWRKVSGLGDDRIIGLGMKDNFWQMGETGPCGPCTEIHWFNGDVSGGVPYATFGDEPTPDGLGWTELWNLVFMQFDRSLDAGGAYVLNPLPKPCVDTGAGLERLSSVLQGVTSNYDSDLLRALVEKASQLSGKPYGGTQADDDVSMRVIADHARTTAFLIAEGVFPDRAGREYVLRRVMRRAIRHGHRLGIREPFLHEVAAEVVSLMSGQYEELARRKELIVSVARQEEERFRETIERGLKILDEDITALGGAGSTLSGEAAFRLYDTYGFPADLTQVIAAERGVGVDMVGYERALEEARARSEGSKLGDAAIEHVWRDVSAAVRERSPSGVRFVGYEQEAADGRVLAIVEGGRLVQRAGQGVEAVVVTDVTPFYGQSGGQVGDKGVLSGRGGAPSPARFEVADTQKPVAGVIAHFGKVTQGELAVGDAVHLEVDHALRTATRRNHSATHLLHWALRTVLGEQATQKGSLVGPDRLRFDFSHGRPVTPEEIRRIEDLVNAKVLLDAPVLTEILPIDEARRRGAVAIFEEKYGDVVRMLTMTSDSVELCGGTHARSLGEIGLFKILSEQGLAAGVRRIEAATGLNALAYVRWLEEVAGAAARTAGTAVKLLPERVEKMQSEKKLLEKEISELKRRVALGGQGPAVASAGAAPGGAAPAGQARDIPGGKALAERIAVADAATLREVAEQRRDKLGSAVVLVGAAGGDKAMLVLTVSKDLTNRYHAGRIIKDIAQMLGGSGGGRPDLAQAGGTQVERLDEALDSLYPRLESVARGEEGTSP